MEQEESKIGHKNWFPESLEARPGYQKTSSWYSQLARIVCSEITEETVFINTQPHFANWSHAVSALSSSHYLRIEKAKHI